MWYDDVNWRCEEVYHVHKVYHKEKNITNSVHCRIEKRKIDALWDTFCHFWNSIMHQICDILLLLQQTLCKALHKYIHMGEL